MSWERPVPESYYELTESDGSDAPMHTAVKKLEGKAQVCGEAEYTDDIPPVKNEVFAAYVYSTVANCRFEPDNVDITAAMVSGYWTQIYW